MSLFNEMHFEHVSLKDLKGFFFFVILYHLQQLYKFSYSIRHWYQVTEKWFALREVYLNCIGHNRCRILNKFAFSKSFWIASWFFPPFPLLLYPFFLLKPRHWSTSSQTACYRLPLTDAALIHSFLPSFASGIENWGVRQHLSEGHMARELSVTDFCFIAEETEIQMV